MKKLDIIKANAADIFMSYKNFVNSNKVGLFYYIDYWGIQCCKEIGKGKRYHNFYYPYIDGKNQSIINMLEHDSYRQNYMKIIICEKEKFDSIAEKIIRNNTNIPTDRSCLFKYLFNGKIYFETGIYTDDEKIFNKKIISFLNRGVILDKKNIIGWFPSKKFYNILKENFKISF